MRSRAQRPHMNVEFVCQDLKRHQIKWRLRLERLYSAERCAIQVSSGQARFGSLMPRYAYLAENVRRI